MPFKIYAHLNKQSFKDYCHRKNIVLHMCLALGQQLKKNIFYYTS